MTTNNSNNMYTYTNVQTTKYTSNVQEPYNNLYKTYTGWCINIQVRYHASVQISPKHRDNRQLSCNITRLIQCRGYKWDRFGLTHVTPMIPVIILIDMTGGWRRGRGQIWLITSAENEKKNCGQTNNERKIVFSWEHKNTAADGWKNCVQWIIMMMMKCVFSSNDDNNYLW